MQKRQEGGRFRGESCSLGVQFDCSDSTAVKSILCCLKVIEIPDEPEKSPGMESKDEAGSIGGKEVKETEAVSREAGPEKEVEEEKKTSATDKEAPNEVKSDESDIKNNDGKEVY